MMVISGEVKKGTSQSREGKSTVAAAVESEWRGDGGASSSSIGRIDTRQI